MELVILAVVIIAAVWFFDFDKPVREIAQMANREVSVQNASHKVSSIKAINKLDLSAEDAAKAKTLLAELDAFDI